MASAVLLIPVDAPVRSATRRAVVALLASALAFVAFAWLTKELAPFRDATPWQADPYDAVVSSTLFFAPLAAALMLVRVPLCRRIEPLPASRLIAIQRAGVLVILAVGATLGADWLAVALGMERAQWTMATTAAVGLLALTTAVALIAGGSLVIALRERPRLTSGALGPDWLDDGQTLLVQYAGRIRPGLSLDVGHWLTALIEGPHGLRRHRDLVIVIASLLFGLAIATSHLVEEGGARSVAATVRVSVLFVLVSGAGMGAFLTAADRYLGLFGHRHPVARSRRDLAIAAAVAAASIPVSAGLRDQLAAVTHGVLVASAPEGLLGLTAIVALASGAATLVALRLIRIRSLHGRDGADRDDE